MRKIAFAVIIISFVLFACKKSNSSPNQSNYGITAVVNGQNVSFNYGMTVDTSQQGVMIIQGYIDSTVTSPYIFMNLQFTYPLSLGIYAYGPLIGGGSGSLSYIGNHAGTPQVFVSSDDSIIVATITKTNITGTFFGSAQYYVQDPNTGGYVLDSTKIFTNGKFNIKPGQN
jgi:hypothetical protein